MTHATLGPLTFVEEQARVFPDGDVDKGGYRINAPDVEQVAYVWNDSKRWGDNPTPFGTADAKAYAQLFAASPDMLAALKWARTCVPFPSDCHAAIVAAITKAEMT
jgi:hypothetical protein